MLKDSFLCFINRSGLVISLMKWKTLWSNYWLIASVPVRKEDPGEELILPSFPHRFVINVVFLIVDCLTYFYKTSRVKAFLVLVPLPFHVSGFCSSPFVRFASQNPLWNVNVFYRDYYSRALERRNFCSFNFPSRISTHFLVFLN